MTILKDIVQIEKGRKYNLLEENQQGAIRVFQANDFRNENKMLYTLDQDGVLAEEDDIMLVWDGSVGQMGFGRSGYVGSTMVKLKVKDKEKYSPFFIYRLLQTKSEYLKRKATGATIKHINRKSLEQIRIPNINLDDQIHIANFLNKAEDLINQRKESINLLDEYLKSTFLEMFGDPASNLRGWDITTLESLCSKIVDCPHETPKYIDEDTGYYCIRSSDIQEGIVDFSSIRSVSEQTYFHRISRHEPAVGEVVYTREGGRLGNAARIPENKKICLGQRTMLFIANSAVSNNDFLWSTLNSQFIKEKVKKLSGGGAAPRINISQLKTLRVLRPPLKIQNQFSEIVKSIDKQKTQCQQSLQELEKLYGSLSQKAFNGELNLS